MNPRLDARVVYLSHYIPLYQVRVLHSLAEFIPDFHILLSTALEPNREFKPDWSGLDVTVQKSLTLQRPWRHARAGFKDTLYVHIPYDTGRRLRELKPDVVVSLELGARSVGAARYRRRYPESRLVLCTYMSGYTEQGRGWLRQQLRRRLLNAADAVTYNGPMCRQYLEGYGLPASKLFHFPYAANDRLAYSGPVERCDSETRRRLLCVGQLIERKGVLPFVKQLCAYSAQRPARQLQVTFAGDGPLRERLASIHTPGNLQLQFLGHVPAEDLRAVMKQHGAAISPTLADEWLMTVNESLQAGLPFIGSIYAQAVSTLIQDNFNGWQFDPHRGESLAAALDSYFDASSENITQMRHNARESVAERTPQWAARGLIEALKHVLSTRTNDGGDASEVV